MFKEQFKRLIILLGAVILFGAAVRSSFSQGEKNNITDSNAADFTWVKLTDGIEFTTYHFINDANVIKQEIYLVRIDPRKIKTNVAIASDLNLPSRIDIKSISRYSNALVGINANFFDVEGKPLGLIIRDGKKLNKLHGGGKTLSGIFYIKNGLPGIVFRDMPLPANVTLAIQSGPRLVANGEKSKLVPSAHASRRSGVAVTYDKQIIIYATLLRFPGTTLEQVQDMLLLKELNIKDALNLDGGSSSQLYIDKSITTGGEEIFITGGDVVPVGLVFGK